MADMESGLDLFSSGIGLEPDEDWPPGEPDGSPSSDVGSVAMPAGDQPADGARTVPAAAVPECLDAGFFPRGGLGPGPGAGGSGFASGDVLDTALPGAVVAGLVDAAAGTSRGYAGLDDDELIGALVAWQRTEAWVAAGKLSAVAELIRRRPGDLIPVPRLSDGPGDGPGPAAGPGPSPSDSPGPGNGAGSSDGLGPSSGDAPVLSAAPAGPDAGAAGGGWGPIPAGWGKFCADELAVALAISQRAADRMLALAADLAVRLPGTTRALEHGVIDAFKAQIIAEATRILDDAGAAAAEALVLPTIEGKTPGQVRGAIARAVVQTDPGAARRRREQAQRDARVELWREDAGTAVLRGSGLPPDEALTADQRISDRALELKAAGMGGTMDQLRVRVYLDTLLGQDSLTALAAQQDPSRHHTSGPGDGTSAPGNGPRASWDNGRPAGTAARINLTIPLATLLGLAERPGEAAGFGPVDPDLARAMAAAAATHPATTWCLTVTDQDGHPTAHGCARPTHRARPGPRHRTDPDNGTGGQATGPPPGTSPPRMTSTRPSGMDDGSPGGRGRRHGHTTRGPDGPDGSDTGPPGRDGGYGTWRLRSVDHGPDLTVDLEPLAVTDCDHRHETAAHDPSDRLRHLIHIRDGECTWPPCRRSARRCDFEHAIPWEAGGRTCGCNAGARCRHHHHQKQAAGWRMDQHRPGYHTWTTPSGRQYTTGPTTYPI